MATAQLIRGTDFTIGAHLPGLTNNPSLFEYLGEISIRSGLPTDRTEHGDRLPDLLEHPITQRLEELWPDELPYLVIIDHRSPAGITTAGTLAASGEYGALSGQNPLGSRPADVTDSAIIGTRIIQEAFMEDVADLPEFWTLAIFHNLNHEDEQRLLAAEETD